MANPKINAAEKYTPPIVKSASESSAKYKDTGWGLEQGIMESDERNDNLQPSKLAKFPFLSNPNLLFGNSQTTPAASKCQKLIVKLCCWGYGFMNEEENKRKTVGKNGKFSSC